MVLWSLKHRCAGLVVMLMVVGAVAASCSTTDSGGASPVPGGKRSSDAGSVTVALSWDGPQSGLVFKVAMDTHSVDLDGFDLARLAALRTAEGTEVAPASWEAPAGGHHREGRLTFPEAVEGRPLLTGTTRAVVVVIRDVAAAERRFEWTW